MNIEQRRLVFKLTMGGFLIGWYLKAPSFYWCYLAQTCPNLDINLKLFPDIFLNHNIALFFFSIPIINALHCLNFSYFLSKISIKFSSVMLTLSSSFMMLHINTYNDVGFITSFWVSLWLIWFAFNMDWPSVHFERHAIRLALAVVTLIFLGGAIGKCTKEWWSGEVLLGIMEVNFIHFPFNWLKLSLNNEHMILLSKILSRSLILTEILISTCLFWPRRAALFYTPILILGIVIFRTWIILSVLSCLISMLWACLKLYPATKSYDHPQN